MKKLIDILEKLDINNIKISHKAKDLAENLEIILGQKIELISQFYDHNTYRPLDKNGYAIEWFWIDIYKDSTIRFSYRNHGLDFEKNTANKSKIIKYKISDIRRLEKKIKNIIYYIENTGELLYSWKTVDQIEYIMKKLKDILEKLDINKVNLNDKSYIINKLESCLGYKLDLITEFYKYDTYVLLDEIGNPIENLHIDIYKKDSAIRITYDRHSLDFEKTTEYSNRIVTYKLKDIIKLQGMIKNFILYVEATGEMPYSWSMAY